MNMIQDLIDRNALFVVNHSGGKDSQAMFLKIRELVPADQIVCVHAHLEGVEWDGVIEHIYSTIGDTPLHVVRSKKSFFDMVEHRGMFPSPKYRQCTSDLKRGPLEKLIRRLCKERGNGLVVSCMGLRAEESHSRAKKETFKLSASNSKAGREWYEWLPVHDMLVGEVFGSIEAAGEEAHWAYAAGMTRLSCCFCIMSSDADLKTAAKLRPELLAKYVEVEKRLGFTLRMDQRGLDEVCKTDKPETDDTPDEEGDLEIPDFLDRRKKKQVIHGLPINGTHKGKPMIEALAGGSFLASYFYTRPGNNKLGNQVERAIELVGKDEIFMLDNGAFTAHTQNVELDDEYHEGFYQWATDIMDRCPQALVVIPDVIGGTVAQNSRLASQSGFSGDWRGVYVWHLNEPIDYLLRVAEEYNHIAFGSAGEYWDVGSSDWTARVDEALAALDAHFKHPDQLGCYVHPKIHMFRGVKTHHKYPFNSSDSVNVARNHRRQLKNGEDLDQFISRVEKQAKVGPVVSHPDIGTPAEIHADELYLRGLIQTPHASI